MSQTEESEFAAASALACLAKEESAAAGKSTSSSIEISRGEEKEVARDGGGDDEKQKGDRGSSHEKGGEEVEFTIPQRYTKSGRKRAVPFSIKLMKVLSDKKNAEIITWMPSGKSFNILKPKAFVAEILPHHFKTAKYSSFTRKLHRWGFMRHYRGEEAGAFYHKDFQRGRLDLVEQMTCYKAEPPKSPAAISDAAAAVRVVKPVAMKPIVATAEPVPVNASRPITANVMAIPSTAVAATFLATPLSRAKPVAISLPAGVPSPPMASAAAAALDTERLNAAIELEVNRRIKERINAVALSRQAFAVSAVRQQQLRANSELMQAILLQKQAGLFQNKAPAVPVTNLGYRALNQKGEPLQGAPPTNIQGARTA